MKTLEPFKKGDTFAFYANISDKDGNPINNIQTNLKCQMRTFNDELIADLTILATDIDGQYLFKADDTNNFPVESTLFIDIQLTDGEIITSSETFSVMIIKDVTR